MFVIIIQLLKCSLGYYTAFSPVDAKDAAAYKQLNIKSYILKAKKAIFSTKMIVHYVQEKKIILCDH